MPRSPQPPPAAAIRARDGLVAAAAVLAAFGAGAVASLSPTWHLSTLPGGIELVHFTLFAFVAGLLLSAVAATPPSCLAVLRRATARALPWIALAALLAIFSFRILTGRPLHPYGNGLGCVNSPPTHVVVVSMYLFPAVALGIGLCVASLIGALYRALPGWHWVARAQATLVLTATIALIAIAGMSAAPIWWLVTAVAIIGLTACIGERRLAAASFAGLASVILVGLYL